ncbi:cobalamin B12-binding domain-containing protein [Methanobrevibacter arboriphilus]|uniref:cobalamin B12-binding domain-containing protein n=1 Tax=Methanobrevibacter arboriphilus TaxID=39441 RepID=UPI000A785CFB|nr:cobalamin B12-binding domain-containing protein [Methanobrevibacter arboriphilus]
MKNTDVVLINPMDKTIVRNGLGLSVPPLNLMYLAGALEKASIAVQIFDDDLHQVGPKQINKYISKVDPKVVGITATTATIKESLAYIKNIKKTFPNILTVIGGPHTTFRPIETLKEENGLDVVVIGEGEKNNSRTSKKLH